MSEEKWRYIPYLNQHVKKNGDILLISIVNRRRRMKFLHFPRFTTIMNRRGGGHMKPKLGLSSSGLIPTTTQLKN